jgi:DNA-binding transcriptional MerR regulator
MPEQAVQKLFYKIGEVCAHLGLEPYTLRYWEKEFPFLSPRKNSSGQRIYSAEDMRLIERIRTLLYEEGFTIEGARRQIANEEKGGAIGTELEALREENRRLRRAIEEAREELRLLLAQLRRKRS